MVNHAAGFNHCTSELQDRMGQNVAFLQTHLCRGKSSREVSDDV